MTEAAEVVMLPEELTGFLLPRLPGDPPLLPPPPSKKTWPKSTLNLLHHTESHLQKRSVRLFSGEILISICALDV